MISPHGLRFAESRFWVTHRRREYGPFDYEWSKDLRGVELTYRDQKFGEYCSDDEIYADLTEFKLPLSVVEVGSIVIGCIVFALLNGLGQLEFAELLTERLKASGHGRFLHIDQENGTNGIE